MKKTIAVITGDLVRSRRISQKDIPRVIQRLEDIFAELNRNLLNGEAAFDIFRGDSFQVAMGRPERALLAAIIIRAGLRSFKPSDTTRLVLHAYTDARIAIGLGGVKHWGGSSDNSHYNDYLRWKKIKVSESHGQAFELSGFLLDRMKKKGMRLGISTPWKVVNQEFQVESMLADALINQWTPHTSDAVYRHLLYRKTQTELAENLGISQPAIHKRLIVGGNIVSIKAFIDRYMEVTKALVAEEDV